MKGKLINSTYNEVCDKSLIPEKTETYTPIPNNMLINQIRIALGTRNYTILEEWYRMNRSKTQMFAVFKVESAEYINEWSMSIGAVNSYNKTRSLGLAVGANVHLCDNLSFSSFRKMRRHTSRLDKDFVDLINLTVEVLEDEFEDVIERHRFLQRVPIKTSQIKSLLGYLIYGEYLTPTQLNMMIKNIKNNHNKCETFFDFLMQFTEVMKLSHPGNIIFRTIRGENFILSKAKGANEVLARLIPELL